MSRIYEALEHEQNQRKALERAPIQKDTFNDGTDTHSVVRKQNSACYKNDPWEEEMASLYYSLQSLTRQKSMVIQLVGSIPGEGTTTVINQFGRISAVGLGKSVLVLRTQRNDHRREEFDTDYEGPTVLDLERLGNGASAEEIFSSKQEGCLLEWSLSNSGSVQKILSSSRMPVVIEKLREHFDLILVDTPPITSSSLGLALCQHVDGVVLVIEAEKTKRSSAQKLKEKVELAGGNILGVVLNKHREHLPEIMNNRV